MSLNVHHLNCATLCPVGKRAFTGQGRLLERTKLVCHCLLVETEQGLILVDTGLGYRDILHTKWLDNLFPLLSNPLFLPEETAYEQITQLGFSTNEVTHIILTHLDPDHAGGLADFPNAEVHLLNEEYIAATQPASFRERHRYVPAQWTHNPRWRLHTPTDESWYGFEKITLINDKLCDIFLIPLQGHTRGHCGVAISTPNGWILHAGDAYMNRSELVNAASIHSAKQHPNIGFSAAFYRWFCKIDSISNQERLINLIKLRELAIKYGEEIDIFCSHDPEEFHFCQKHAAFI